MAARQRDRRGRWAVVLRWNALTQPWQCCLEEAWTAYCMGSIPIGAVITDPQELIVARGRNRIFEEIAPGKLLCGNRLAHAEMNALIALDWHEVEPQHCVLYTTTEPCALCIGAIRMTRLGAVHYAARDSAAGSTALLDATPFMRRSGLQVAGPMYADLEALVVALHVEFSLRNGHLSRSSWALEMWQTTVPQGVSLGQDLLRSGHLQRWRAEGASIAQVVTRLSDSDPEGAAIQGIRGSEQERPHPLGHDVVDTSI
jgi:tRNA(adenine34) deaminase